MHRRRAPFGNVDGDEAIARMRALSRVRKNELMPAQADNPDGFWEHLGFVALNDELLSELGGAWDLPPKADETFADQRLDPLRHESAAADRKIRFGKRLGLEGSAQQFDAAILAGAVARTENAHRRAQSARGRSLDAGAKRNFLFVWFAALGNLQPALDRGSKRQTTGLLLITIYFSKMRNRS